MLLGIDSLPKFVTNDMHEQIMADGNKRYGYTILIYLEFFNPSLAPRYGYILLLLEK